MDDDDRWVVEEEKHNDERRLNGVHHRTLYDDPDDPHQVEPCADLETRFHSFPVLPVDLPGNEACSQDILCKVKGEGHVEDRGNLVLGEVERVSKPVPVDDSGACGRAAAVKSVGTSQSGFSGCGWTDLYCQ